MSVSKAVDYVLNHGSSVSSGDRIILFATTSRLILGLIHFLTNEYIGLFLWGLKRPGFADHSSPSNAEV
jgi:hypothetical protein